ncbi:TldD/PmbA family protein [Candidatus Woesearchaeota archaeon]|nr:TldD/PmbA family protein [Candidatus Woesearchaeota archaeon]
MLSAKSLVRIAEGLGADEVVAQLVTENSELLKFVDNKIVNSQGQRLKQANVVMAKDKRLIAVNLKELEEDKAKDVLAGVLKNVSAYPVNEEFGGFARGPFSYREVKDIYDPGVADFGNSGVELLREALKAGRNVKRLSGVLTSATEIAEVASSHDVDAEQKSTSLYFSARAFAEKNASGHGISASRMLYGFSPAKASEYASGIALKALNPVQGEAGRYDVVFEPLPWSNLLSHVGDSSSIYSVETGTSFLAGKEGQQVASREFSLTDDARAPNGIGSAVFDEEGRPSQTTPIIEKGVMKNFLHNTSTAARHNTKSTANAGIISPEPFNLVVKTGTYKNQEIFQGITRGIWVTNVWYTRFQHYAKGDFSTIPRDGMFLIEDGKVSRPIHGLRISDNLPRMLKNVARLGNQPVQIRGWEVWLPVTTPPCLVKDVNFSKSEQ